VRAALFCLCLGVSAVASASQEQSEVDGVPARLDVWRPGVYSVMTPVKTEFRDNGVTGPIFGGNAPGTFPPNGCYAAIGVDGFPESNQNCLPSVNISPEGPTSGDPTVYRVRFTPSGVGYAMMERDGTLGLLYAPAADISTLPWELLTIEASGYLPTEVMAVTDTSGGPQALFLPRIPTQRLLWYQGRDAVAEVLPPAPVATNQEALDLFAGDGPYPIALFGSSAGLFRGPLAPPESPGPISPFTRVTLLGGVTPPAITAVDVNTGQGSVHGQGFGLAVGTDSGGTPVVLGMVPADTASNAGTLWRVHPAFTDPPLFGSPLAVGCVGSAFCVIAVNRPGQGTPNLLLYTNAASPQLTSGTQALFLNEGSSGATRQVTATDADGDAVRVTVDAQAAADVLSVSPTGQPDVLDLVIAPRGEVCKDETRVLNVWASDGLAAHDQLTPLSVTLRNVTGPLAPGVTPTSDSTPAAGPARVFTASPGGGTCATVGYVWEPATPGQPPLVTTPEGTATFTPPDFVCAREGAAYTYTVRGLDEGQLRSLPTSFTVNVTAWGKPSAPFGANAVRALTSGPDAAVDVTPDALLPCPPGTPDLPPVDTVWRLTTPGEGVPPGFTVKDAAGSPVSLTSDVVSGALRVEAAACTRGTLSFTARNRLESVEGVLREGAEGTVQVVATPPVEDANAAALSLAVTPPEEQRVDVALGTSLLCPNDYALQARMVLSEAASGAEVASGVVAVPGTWQPPVPETCDAVSYRVQGALLDTSGQPRGGAGASEAVVTVPPRDVRLGALEGEALVARCGEGATGTLTQVIPAGACRTPVLSWTQEGGPALEASEFSGNQLSVRTRDTGLQGLVGESITLRVKAEASGGRTVTTEQVVSITAEPFVDLGHETESPTGSEKGLVGVVVRLRNTTACPVSGLRHLERVEGLELLPGSVKVDGQPVTVAEAPGGFAVEGVALPAEGTATLTYVARPRLLGSPRFGGEVRLNGVLVSAPLAEEAASGCGCTSSGAGSGAAVLGLAALARLLRRRRDGAVG
jgi:uncharacterized protein (TIGR03382 family)